MNKILKKPVVAVLALLGLFYPVIAQQRPYTPEAGSAERKAIVDTVRGPVSRELKKPVIFKVGSLRVKDGWAVLSATPLEPSGLRFDYHNTKYQNCMTEGDCDDSVMAVLRKQKNAWTIVEYVIGSTDVPAFGKGRKKYKLPSGLLY